MPIELKNIVHHVIWKSSGGDHEPVISFCIVSVLILSYRDLSPGTFLRFISSLLVRGPVCVSLINKRMVINCTPRT